MTPWWLRPTAEGANEEKDRPSPPEPPVSVATESVALAPESLKETPPSLEAEPAWRREPIPSLEEEPDEPEPSPFVEDTGEEELRLGQPELIPEEPEADDTDEEEEEEELSAQSDGADSAASEEAKGAAEAKRRRRRSRGRGRKEGKPAAAGPEEEEDEREEPVYEEPATPRRVAMAPPMAPVAPMNMAAAARSPRSESFTIAAGDLETMAREIVISVPERQRVSEERKIAMFCDLENIALGVRDSDIGKFDIELILERLLEKGKIIVKKAYADWERYSDYKRGFHEAAIELIDIPQKYYSGKNSADIKMVVDAMDLSYSKEHLDTFVMLSGDSDFSPLVSKLKENNKYVIGVGVKNSS
ncbi:MAG TPA: NYN domain-containing protein, partial [Thermoanaerobaculia bacterium]|nr:NYN domain-containing protein [Thermoanaerobaculia bacterium]